VYSGDRNVVNAEIGVVASPEFELILVGAWLDDVDYPACVLVMAETLDDHEIACWLLILDEVVMLVLCLEREWVCRFADFAFKGLPVDGGPAICCLGLRHLEFEPLFEAV